MRITLALLFAFVTFAMCHAGEPMIVGHRGASFDAPENTMAAFNLAWKQGADGVEGDFYLTRDGRVVCTHDANTKRVAGDKLQVEESTLAELQVLDVGAWKNKKFKGERMPTLDDVLASVPKGKKLFIELKSKAKVVEPMIEVIKKSDIPLDDLIVISFHDDAIAKCHELMPKLKTHWLTGYKKNDKGAKIPTAEKVAKSLKKSGAYGFGSQADPKHFDKKFIDLLRLHKFDEFHVWTVDKPDVAKYYRDLGVWSITTNRPGWLREQLKKTKDANDESPSAS